MHVMRGERKSSGESPNDSQPQTVRYTTIPKKDELCAVCKECHISQLHEYLLGHL